MCATEGGFVQWCRCESTITLQLRSDYFAYRSWEKTRCFSHHNYTVYSIYSSSKMCAACHHQEVIYKSCVGVRANNILTIYASFCKLISSIYMSACYLEYIQATYGELINIELQLYKYMINAFDSDAFITILFLYYQYV